LDRLGKILNESGSDCYAWVLMDNHFHLLLRTGEVPLAKTMNRLLTSFATRFNLRHQRSGHLFQNRYKSIVIHEERYLATLIAYIHLNPIRAGLISTMADLSGYRWSGHRAMIGVERYSWQDRDFVLDCLGGRQAYLDYLHAVVNQDISNLDGGGAKRRHAIDRQPNTENDARSNDDRILGSPTFVKSLSKLKDNGDQDQRHTDVDGLLAAVCEYFDVTQVEMRSRARSKRLGQARAIFATLAAKNGLAGVEIAKTLNISPPAVTKAMARGKPLLTGTSLTKLTK